MTVKQIEYILLQNLKKKSEIKGAKYNTLKITYVKCTKYIKCKKEEKRKSMLHKNFARILEFGASK